MLLLTVAAVASFYGFAPTEEDSWPIMTPSPRALGSCLNERGPVDLRRVMFLENRYLDLGSEGATVKVELRRQTISFTTQAGTPEETIRVQDVARIVARNQEENPDVYLKLALLDGDVLLYWRETYLHRSYRQGLFRIVGRDLQRFCEGNGGVTITH